MNSFKSWLEERKKSETVPAQTTIVSSPLRGPNQDYSGVNVKNDSAAYTISDGVIAGVGAVRNTPITMSTTTKHKSKNAPRSTGAMQRAADLRRIKLDRLAQRQTENQKKERFRQVKQRQKHLNDKN